MTVQQDSPMQLKGSLFTLTVMHLLNPDLEALQAHLESLIKGSPNFFNHMPIVIDLTQVAEANDLDFSRLSTLLREFGLIPVGVRNGRPEQLIAANSAGLGTLNQKQRAKKTDPEPQTKPNTPPNEAKKPVNTPPIRTKIITTPVRSGQQIYAKGADLIILASVSPGAEILADGNIHVYGTLRGRALAGIQGDTEARIICSALAPEMVSIAGRYQLQDTLAIPPENGPFQVFLEDDEVCCSVI